jgi:hypothetical protein
LPTSLASSSITTSSATISWAAASPAPANGYEYYLSTSSTAPTSSTTISGSTAAGVVSASLSSLTANTTYYYWVRSNCNGTDKGNWVSGGSFTTLCLATTLPYSEGFNNTIIPSCWSQQNVVGANNLTFISSGINPTISSAQEGTNMVYWNSYSITSGYTTRLVSMPISTLGISILRPHQ